MALKSIAFLALAMATETSAEGVYHSQLSNHMHEKDLELKSQMRRMMADDDDELPSSLSLHGGKKLQVRSSISDEYYLQDSANSLSTALGPRWNARALDDDAEKSTKALLRGIGGGGRGLRALNGLMTMLR